MKKVYNIGEVGKLLGLSIDAIRFYEKKGLVHPHSNPKNQYREFDNANVLELLDIIYYRHLDISIHDIQEIMKNGTKEVLRELLRNKRIETQKHIRYEEQLVKKIIFIESISEDIDERINHCMIRQLPAYYLLSRSNKAHDVIIRQLPNLSEDEFVLCSLIHKHSLDNMEIYESVLTLEKTIVEQLAIKLDKGSAFIPEQDCIYMIIKTKHEILHKADIEPLYAYAREQQIAYGDILYVKEIPLTSYADTDNYYAEIFLPILST